MVRAGTWYSFAQGEPILEKRTIPLDIVTGHINEVIQGISHEANSYNCLGAIICSSFARCKLACAASLFTVPSTPSQAFFPCDVVKKIPFCIKCKVITMLHQIHKIFMILVFPAGVNHLFQHWKFYF